MLPVPWADLFGKGFHLERFFVFLSFVLVFLFVLGDYFVSLRFIDYFILFLLSYCLSFNFFDSEVNWLLFQDLVWLSLYLCFFCLGSS